MGVCCSLLYPFCKHQTIYSMEMNGKCLPYSYGAAVCTASPKINSVEMNFNKFSKPNRMGRPYLFLRGLVLFLFVFYFSCAHSKCLYT